MLLRYDPQPALDVTDSLLLGLLQQKARLSFAYLGRRLRLSAPAVAERMKRMEDRGVIRAYAPRLTSQNSDEGCRSSRGPAQGLFSIRKAD